MKRKEREGAKPIGGIGPGVGLSVRQVVVARLIKKSKGKKQGGREAK